ncbi:MAB_1171c family putative transporter [Streptomyces sp. NPDC048606]|uniref:MAB_1171c family putative transporter n=1 Tax=Streptomyces sp. NPDC048606 TaxID=3154726 RepID=UPI00341EC999
MSDPLFLIPSVLGAVAILMRLPSLLRDPRDPLLRAVTAFLFSTTGVFFFGAVPMIAKVNAVSGIPNLAAPFVYTWVMACSGSGIVLVINWRGGPPERIRRASRGCVAGYAALSVALFVLFALGDAPVERLRDLDTYYANTPYIREMIVLYLLAHGAAAVTMSSLCWRWLPHVTGELRAGLALMMAGYALTLGYALCKFAAVGARWAGLDWDVLSTDVARALSAAAAPLVAFAFGVPLVVQRLREPWRDWTRYRRLGPLSRLVGNLAPRATTVRMVLLCPVGVRRLQRESAIRDGLLTLNPYFDLGLRARVFEAARARGACPDEASAGADAAMLLAAVRALRADPERRVITSSRGLQEGTGEYGDLVRISQSLSHTPAGNGAGPRGVRASGGTS